MVANKFEDLLVWQNARELSRELYLITNKWSDYSLKDQIRRAMVSVSSNIAEGFDRGSNADFKRFLYISRGSASEVRSQLYLAKDIGYITGDEFTKIYKAIDYIVRQLTLLISRIKN